VSRRHIRRVCISSIRIESIEEKQNRDVTGGIIIITKPVYWQAPVSACSEPSVYRWSNVLSSLCCCLMSTS
jgi:hypothetical protein